MPPTHAKMPTAMREKCAHGGPMHCTMGCYSKGGRVSGEEETTEHVPVTGGISNNFGDAEYVVEHLSGSKKRFHAQEGEHASAKKEAEEYRKRNLHKKYAEGGGVESLDDPMEHEGKEHEGDEHELGKVLAEELMTAMEHKDHKGVMEAIEAIVMNCMSKGGM